MQPSGVLAMDNNPPISADELKSEFDKLKSVFVGSDSDAKFNASAQMMVLISRYLSHNIEAIDVFPITSVLGEYSRIAEGAAPEFIKSQKEISGRPADSTNQMYSASIVSAIDILSKYGYSVSQAIRYVAKVLERDEKRIKQLRADFNRRKMKPDVENFKRQQSSIVFSTERDAKGHALALLAMVKAGIE